MTTLYTKLLKKFNVKQIYSWLHQKNVSSFDEMSNISKPHRALLNEEFYIPEMKILDTHLGSGSSAIASHYFGCDFTGIEIDKTYFELTKKRYETETLQTQLF